MTMPKRFSLLAGLAIGFGVLLGAYTEIDACTRVFWNTLPDLKVVARNEDYLTPVDPTMVITPRGIARIGSKEDNAVRWTSKYGNVCMFANNRFPMDGMHDVVVKGAWSGPGALSFVPHALAPLAELPVREIIGATHLVMDMTLEHGEVVHDYLA